MLMSQGFIYILINPSIPGLAKVGKTTRSTQERVSELSSATGIPSPFIVVYEHPVEDCHAVEKWVHSELERRGFRAANNREFFTAPIHEIVNLIVLGKDVKNSENILNLQKLNPDEDEDFSEELAELADKYSRGSGDILRDSAKALQLYEQAAKLGNSYAANRAAELLIDGASNIKSNPPAALEYLKMAISINPSVEWKNNGKIAKIYSELGQSLSAIKYWKEFIKHIDQNTSSYSIDPLWRYCYDVANGKIESELNEATLGLYGPILIDATNSARTHNIITDIELEWTKKFIIHCVGKSWE